MSKNSDEISEFFYLLILDCIAQSYVITVQSKYEIFASAKISLTLHSELCILHFD